MASEIIFDVLPHEIRQLLAALRWRIRAYVWLHGLSLAIAWLGLTFWCGLALDYLPVLAGIGEMPRFARVVLLLAIAGVLAFILYNWVFRRVFVRLADRSMAMLLERRNRELGESLITTVELSNRASLDSERAAEMFAATRSHAVQQLRDIRLESVFNFRPLAMSVTSAVVMMITVGVFYVVNANAWELGVGRLYFLNDDPWPRNARIEVVGVELRELGDLAEDNEILKFRNQTLKVAKGANLALLVRADASRPKVPEVCAIHYHTAEGDYGRVNMTRIGRIRDGYQLYRYEGKPFDGILSDIEFDAVGFDHRISGYRLLAVDSPTVVAVEVECQFPAYMVDEKLSLWLPRTIELTPGMQLPRGTQLTLHARSNKPLTQVLLSNPDIDQTEAIEVAGDAKNVSTFAHVVEKLEDHLTLDITLTDIDEVRSERPYRIHISGIEDTPPVIDMRLRGIGSAVTPNALIPTLGKISDDYGLSKAWLEVVLNDLDPTKFPLQPAPTGETEFAVDFRVQRGLPNGISLAAGSKLHLTVKAMDRRDLGNGPNQASGDHYQLDVVSPEQLLTLLEARELGLRRRFEQVISELAETRDMLIRIRSESPESATRTTASTEKGENERQENREKERAAKDAASQAEEQFKRVWSLRLLRTRQSLLQSQKSAQEVLGIAASFQDIYEELINNRVDTEDRKTRLKEQIAGPLQRIAETGFRQLDQTLEKLAAAVSAVESSGRLDVEDPATTGSAQAAIDHANRILMELESVLQKMLDLESFNELLDIVRGLIDDQERLSTETKKEQKKAVLDLLK